MYTSVSILRIINILLVGGIMLLLASPAATAGYASPAQVTLSTIPFDRDALANEVFTALKTNPQTEIIVTLSQPDIPPRDKDKSTAQYLREVREKNNAMEEGVLSQLTPSEFNERYRFENFAGFTGMVNEAGLRKLLAHPSVKFVEPVRMLQAHLAQGIALMNAATVRTSYNGSGMAIAVCDTGIDYTHVRLGGGGFPNSKVLGGYDFGDGDSNPIPNAQAHGTCCAGIAAGDLGTVSDYIGGVAYNAKLYAVKISQGTTGSASSAAMVSAWDWCVTHQNDNASYPIMVISTSFGGGRYYSNAAGDAASPGMTTAANNAVAAGITVLASSGNDGFCDSMGWPAAISSVISVGAVYDASFGTYLPCVDAGSCAPKTYDTGCSTNYYATDATAPDRVTSYSNTASFLTLLAPSNRCYTTDITGSTGYSTGDYYASFGGTSAACPYAAGAVACLQSAALSLIGRYLTVTEVRNTLTSTGVNITDPKVAITKPRINLDAAVASLPPPALQTFGWSTVSSPQYLDMPFGVTVTALNSIGQPYTGFTGTVNLSGLIPSNSEITIGTGTATGVFPMGTYYHDERTQVIYLASEIGGARKITSLSLYVSTTPGQTMNFWTIRMKHTALSAYATASWEGSGWTKVYQANQTVSTTGWVTFTFTTPFYYDGTNNLMVDFSFNNASYTTNGRCRYSTPGGNRTIYLQTDSGYGDPLTWSGTTPSVTLRTYVPNIRLGGTTYTPVPITPTVSGSFVSGVWTGNITVLATATGMLLRADDGSGHIGDSNIFNVVNNPPTVTGVNPAAGATLSSTSVNVDVTFSETVVGVDATDMVLSGTAAGSAIVSAPTNPSGTTWRFPLSGLMSGVLNISLAPDVGDIQDVHGADLSPRPTIWSYTIAIPTDYGDAPAPYATLLASNGARHITGSLYLGSSIDAESDGQPQTDALGDDNTGIDDEDGVVFTSPLRVGQTAGIQVTASASGMLDAWIDFNGDGDWIDSGEQVFNSQSVVAGSNALSISVPATAQATSKTFARFRLSAAGGLTPTGLTVNGEVEDYAVVIGLTAPVLAAEPAYTPGTSNTLSWSSVPGASAYYIEYDTDNTLVSPDGNSGWIAGLSHTFNGLSDGETYYYHVRARNVTASVTSAWSNIVFSSQDATLPGVTMTSSRPDPTNLSPIPVTVTFTENVSGFEALDIVPGNGAVNNFQVVDAAHYTFDLTPAGQGAVTANIAAGVAQDIAGNSNTACTQFGRVYDTVSPNVTMTSTEPDPTNSSPIPVTVTFTENVTGFDALDIVPGNATVDNFQTVDGAHYTFELTPADQGVVTANLAAGIAHDAAGNGNTSAAFSRLFNSIRPNVTMTSTIPEYTQTTPIPVSVTFDADVTGFIATDIAPGNATVDNFQAVDGAHYTFDLTPAGQGLVTADIPEGVAKDSANNLNWAAAQFSRTYDTVRPDVTMTSGAPNPTNTSPIPVTVTFTENVSGFDALDIVPGNATVDNFQTVDDAHYTFDLLPSGQGSVTADIAADAALDTAGNLNTQCAQFVRTFDSVSPDVAMASTASDPTNLSTIPITVTFTEDVSGFDALDIEPGNATVDNFQTVDAAHYTFDLLPTGGTTVTADIAAGVAHDAAGNPNTECVQFRVAYDNAPPDVTMTSTVPDPTNISPILISVTFTEDVSGFDALDIVPGNASVDNFQTVDAAQYTFELTPTGQGSVTADIAAGVAHDAAGNPNTVCLQFSRVFDSASPDVAMSSTIPDPTNQPGIPVTVTFTEDVSGFDASDIVPGNGTVDNFQTVDAAHYTFDLIPADQGVVTADIAAEVAHDLVGNLNTACAQFIRTYDSISPNVTMTSSAPDPTNLSIIPVTVQFTENVSGFDAPDIVPVNASIENFQSVDASTYTFDLSPTGQGLVTADIAADVAHDAAGNPNTLCEALSRSYDSVAPDVAMSSTAPDPATVAPIHVAVAFTENVTGFTSADIVPGNALVNNFQLVDASHYVFDLVPIEEGLVTADIAAEVALDPAGNLNTACTQFHRMFYSDAPLAALEVVSPSPTGANDIVFSVVFTEAVTPTFDASDVTPRFFMGSLILMGAEAGAVEVTGVDPVYTVTIALTQPDADGMLDILIGTDVTDLGGNHYSGGASPACSIFNWHVPYFTPQPADAQKYTLDHLLLLASPNCGANTITYQWRWEDGSKAVQPGPATQTWDVPGLVPGNEGVYWCEASYDGETHETDHVSIQVRDHLVITQAPEGGSKPAGSSHTFTVETTGGYEPLLYSWKRIPLEGIEEIIFDANDASYTKSNLAQADSGAYTVEVSDANTDAQSASTELTVTKSVPVAGLSGLCVIAGLITLIGVWTVLRKKICAT